MWVNGLLAIPAGVSLRSVGFLGSGLRADQHSAVSEYSLIYLLILAPPPKKEGHPDTTWVKLEDAVLSEVSQPHTDEQRMSPRVWGFAGPALHGDRREKRALAGREGWGAAPAGDRVSVLREGTPQRDGV